jgi:hypothetical protein
MIASELIQRAADMIHDELQVLGTPVSAADALWLATRLHELWTERHERPQPAPGEVAQRLRRRTEYHGGDVNRLLGK